MPGDLLAQLAEMPVPPPPAAFDDALHRRINQRLLAAQILDLAWRGLGYAFVHFARAVAGLIVLSVSGKFEPTPRDGRGTAP